MLRRSAPISKFPSPSPFVLRQISSTALSPLHWHSAPTPHLPGLFNPQEPPHASPHCAPDAPSAESLSSPTLPSALSLVSPGSLICLCGSVFHFKGICKCLLSLGRPLTLTTSHRKADGNGEDGCWTRRPKASFHTDLSPLTRKCLLGGILQSSGYSLPLHPPACGKDPAMPVTPKAKASSPAVLLWPSDGETTQ